MFCFSSVFIFIHANRFPGVSRRPRPEAPLLLRLAPDRPTGHGGVRTNRRGEVGWMGIIALLFRRGNHRAGQTPKKMTFSCVQDARSRTSFFSFFLVGTAIRFQKKTISARYYFVKDHCDTNSSVTRNYLKNSKNMLLCITQPPPLGAPAACAATAQGQEHILHHGLEQQQQQHQKATARRRRGGQANGLRSRVCKGSGGGVIEASCIGGY